MPEYTPPPETNPDQKPAEAKKPEPKFKKWLRNMRKTFTSSKIAGMIALIVTALVGGVFFFKYMPKQNKTSDQNTTSSAAQDFHNAFSNTSISEPPKNLSPGQGTQNITPRGNELNGAPSSPASIVPATTTYRNNLLEFELQLGVNWQAQEHLENRTVVFQSASGESLAIQAYSGSETSIEEIEKQLQGSPSVSQARLTSFKGHDAIVFRSTGLYPEGMAVINGNAIYYIFGRNLEGNILDTFVFI